MHQSKIVSNPNSKTRKITAVIFSILLIISTIFSTGITAVSANAKSLFDIGTSIYGTLTSNYCTPITVSASDKAELAKDAQMFSIAKYQHKPYITFHLSDSLRNKYSSRELSELIHMISMEQEENEISTNPQVNPLIGYYGDSLYSSYSFSDIASNGTFTIHMKQFISPEQEKQGANAAIKAVQSLNLNQYSNPADKVNAIADYVHNIAEYDYYENHIANSVYGTLINHKAQCGGYARTVYLMCLIAGLKKTDGTPAVRIVAGDAFNIGAYHGWNTYGSYIVDATRKSHWSKPGETYDYQPEIQGNNTYLIQHTLVND